MPRSFSAGMTAGSLDHQSDITALWFVQINAPVLDGAIRVVSDGADYVWNGFMWLRCGFTIAWPTDTEETPIGTITVQNVDRRIGEAVEAMTGPLTFSCWCLKSTDFDLTKDPREPLGTPSVEAAFTGFKLRNVSLNSARATADLFIMDPGAEQFGRRARKADFPGLYV